MQAAAMQIIYKGVFQWFLKLIVGVQFTDCRFLKKEKQFIILANHNSHLDALSLLASLPGELLWKVKPVAAEDYFGKTRFQASISNFFINTLLIRRKGEKDSEHDPIRKMLEAIDAGYSLILFPEGTRGKPEQMGKIKSGIARIHEAVLAYGRDFMISNARSTAGRISAAGTALNSNTLLRESSALYT